MGTIKRAIIQASSRAWSGGADDSVALYGSEPLFVHTANRLHRAGVESIVVAAPEFDRGGALDSVLEESRIPDARVIYAHNASPLQRCIEACRDLDDDDYVLRVNGMNFTLPELLVGRAQDLAGANSADLIKLPDDYPGAFQFEVSRLGALRRAAQSIDEGSALNIHPRFAVGMSSDRIEVVAAEKSELREDLVATRKVFGELHGDREHTVVNANQAISIGDQYTFHYTLALGYMTPGRSVLDIGCGTGHGSMRLAQAGFRVTGGDITPETIEAAGGRFRQEGLKFEVLDACAIEMADRSFDYITSFETIEHVDEPEKLLSEYARVLRSDGLLFISTPQNQLGEIPTTPFHVREFDFSEFYRLASREFDVVEFIGLKAGTVYFRGDPIGANSFMVARPKAS